MSWMYRTIIDRKEACSDVAAEASARLDFPTAAFVVVTKKTVFVYTPAQISDDVARLLVADRLLLIGSARLFWFEPFMERDIRRTLTENQERDCDCPICSARRSASQGKDPLQEKLLELIFSKIAGSPFPGFPS